MAGNEKQAEKKVAQGRIVECFSGSHKNPSVNSADMLPVCCAAGMGEWSWHRLSV
jgi:hypothetical protein